MAKTVESRAVNSPQTSSTLREMAALKKLLEEMILSAAETIKLLEKKESSVEICVPDDGQVGAAELTPRAFYIYEASLNKYYNFAKFKLPQAALPKRLGSKIGRDLNLASRVTFEMKKHDMKRSLAIKEVTGVRKIVKVRCKAGGSGGKRAPKRLYRVFLRLYRHLKKVSESLVNERFVNAGTEG